MESSPAPSTPPPEEAQNNFTDSKSSLPAPQEARENPERPHLLTREESIREVVDNHPEATQVEAGEPHKDSKDQAVAPAPAFIPAPPL